MRAAALVARFMASRMARDVPSLIQLLATPLVLTVVLGAVFSSLPPDIPYLRGVGHPATFVAFGMLVMFQLFGGGYSLVFVRNGLLSPMGQRIRALPVDPSAFVLGTVLAGTAVSVVQGGALVAFSRVALGVRWGDPALVLATVALVSLLAQLVQLSFLLGLRNAGLAQAFGWAFAYGSCVAGGLIFPLPTGKPFFAFLVAWGGPYSLAQTALRAAGADGSPARAALALAALAAACAAFAALVAALGRRRLA